MTGPLTPDAWQQWEPEGEACPVLSAGPDSVIHDGPLDGMLPPSGRAGF